jgi:hypothetical protein
MDWEREILRLKETFEIKIEEIRIKPGFEIFSKKIQNFKVKTKFKMYCKYITN